MLLQEQELPQNQRPPTKKANGNTEEPQGKPDRAHFGPPGPYLGPWGPKLINYGPLGPIIIYFGAHGAQNYLKMGWVVGGTLKVQTCASSCEEDGEGRRPSMAGTSSLDP